MQQQVADARQELRDDTDALRRRVDSDWTDVRRDIADAHNRYTAWDTARERRFNAHLDEADAVLREAGAQASGGAADARGRMTDAQQDLRDNAAAARQSYDAWRERRSDQELQRKLNDAELELEEASNRYAAARENVQQRGQQAGAD